MRFIFFSIILIFIISIDSEAQIAFEDSRNNNFGAISNTDNAILNSKNYINSDSFQLNDTSRLRYQIDLIKAYQLKNYPDSAWLILKPIQKLIEALHTSQCSEVDYWWIAKTYYQEQKKAQAKIWLAYALESLSTSPNILLRKYYSNELQLVSNEMNDYRTSLIYKNLSDSLEILILNDDYRANKDSLFRIVQDNEDSIKNLNKQIIASEETNHKKLFTYGATVLIGFLILIVVFIILLSKKSKNNKSTQKENITSVSNTIQNSSSLPDTKTELSNIFGLSSLLLEKVRTGDDLNYLKSIQQMSFNSMIKLRDELKRIDTLDEETIIKNLKGIRIIIYTSNNYTGMMLKDYLRKKIRLCTINLTHQIQGIDINTADVLIADDTTTRIKEEELIPTIYLHSNMTFIEGIQKPFIIDEILNALMDVYEIKNSFQTEAIHQEQIISLNDEREPSEVEKLLSFLSEARVEKDRTKIVEIIKSLQPHIQQERNIKWFDTIINHHEELNDLQLEIALRNIVSYSKGN